ncbi:MAG TPA: hypothetical protein PLQ97_09855 [Myxococcota bacterium]|mgnify:CR=1 FL=1|nr:hypothetical protein [Myxococcota bacterium]HQK51182.1 hypothetical protein [Myxococcota bacterium]
MKSTILGLVLAGLVLLAAPGRADACEGCGCGAKEGKDAPAVFGAPEGGCPHAKAIAEGSCGQQGGGCPAAAQGSDSKAGCGCEEGQDRPCKDCPCKKDGTCPCKDGKACADCKDCPCKKDGRCQCGHGGQCPHHAGKPQK